MTNMRYGRTGRVIVLPDVPIKRGYGFKAVDRRRVKCKSSSLTISFNTHLPSHKLMPFISILPLSLFICTFVPREEEPLFTDLYRVCM